MFNRKEITPALTAEFAGRAHNQIVKVPDDVKIIDLIRYSGEVRRVPYAFEDESLQEWYEFVDGLASPQKMVLNKLLGSLTRAHFSSNSTITDSGVIYDLVTMGQLKRLSPKTLEENLGFNIGIGFMSYDFLVAIGLLQATLEDT